MKKSDLLCVGTLILCFFGKLAPGQIRETPIPLGDALDRALTRGSLVSKEVKPFHIKVHVIESTNPGSDYRAEIEEFWVSDGEWRRSIDSPEFKQIIVVNDAQVNERDTGEYYPLWLQHIATALFNPVPDRDVWNRLGAQITQISLPNGQRSDACARQKFKVGSSTVQNDAFSNVCFDGDGLLKFVSALGYGMEFHDYKKFGKVRIAHSLREDPEPGTTIISTITLLEELKRIDQPMFSVVSSTPMEKRIQSVIVPQDLIEAAVISGTPISWPPVQSGNTRGLLTMYVSVDRLGNIREVYPLNSDNAGLQDAARDQLLKWKLKPLTLKGITVQGEAALSFKFETRLASPPPK
jgi:hypothetical protein